MVINMIHIKKYFYFQISFRLFALSVWFSAIYNLIYYYSFIIYIDILKNCFRKQNSFSFFFFTYKISIAELKMNIWLDNIMILNVRIAYCVFFLFMADIYSTDISEISVSIYFDFAYLPVLTEVGFQALYEKKIKRYLKNTFMYIFRLNCYIRL